MINKFWWGWLWLMLTMLMTQKTEQRIVGNYPHRYWSMKVLGLSVCVMNKEQLTLTNSSYQTASVQGEQLKWSASLDLNWPSHRANFSIWCNTVCCTSSTAVAAHPPLQLLYIYCSHCTSSTAVAAYLLQSLHIFHCSHCTCSMGCFWCCTYSLFHLGNYAPVCLSCFAFLYTMYIWLQNYFCCHNNCEEFFRLLTAWLIMMMINSSSSLVNIRREKLCPSDDQRCQSQGGRLQGDHGDSEGGAGAVLQEAAVPSRDDAELLINLMDKLIFFCHHIEFWLCKHERWSHLRFPIRSQSPRCQGHDMPHHDCHRKRERDGGGSWGDGGGGAGRKR